MKIYAKHLYALSLVATLALSHQSIARAETAAGAPKSVAISGKVLETLDGGGYTYVLLKTGNEKMWVAAPLMKVAVGQDLKLVPGYELKNFTSKGLNRKFDRIVFSAGLANAEVKLSPAAMKMAHQGTPMAENKAQAPAPAKTQAPANTKAQSFAPEPALGPRLEKPAPRPTGPVAKAKGPNAYTIAQLYAKKTKLEKKPVVVRGRVVKVSLHILKRNWIHLTDGTGTAAKKNNDIIVTTKDVVKVGDVVTAKGTLYNNMDFGSGYRYGVLIEGARFK